MRQIVPTAVMLLLITSGVALADSPRHFLEQALQGDNSEILLGRMAIEKARNPHVQEFGRMLVTDHSQARDEVLRVGRRMGLHANRDVAPEARDEREKLNSMVGEDFDREFVRYMIEDHRKDVTDFRDEASEHHGPVSNLASNQLSSLQKHLDTAMELGRRDDRSQNTMDRERHNGSDHDGEQNSR